MEYSKPEKINIEVSVSRVIYQPNDNNARKYVLSYTPGLRIDKDQCIIVDESIVKGVLD